MIARAALVPIGDFAALEGVDRALGASAWAVSLGDPQPTHLLIVADPLPDALAASAGRVLLGAPEGRAFAERGGPLPDPVPDALALRLHGLPDPLVVRGPGRPLSDFLEPAWSPASDADPGRRPVPVEVRLVPSDVPRAVAAVIAAPADLDEALAAWPEERFRETTFAAASRGGEVYLLGGDLGAFPGEAFHAADRRLFLPLGRRLEPAAALPWLGLRGALFFWRDSGLDAVPAEAFVPLTRRAWSAVRGC